MTSNIKYLLHNLRSAATHFFIAQESHGSEIMIKVADDLLVLSALLSHSDQLKLNSLIEKSVSAQKRHDLISLADTLNFEIHPFLESLQKNEATRECINKDPTN